MDRPSTIGGGALVAAAAPLLAALERLVVDLLVALEAAPLLFPFALLEWPSVAASGG